MTTTMITDLPRDLAEEIFSRVPMKSMRAVRLTCKKWDSLSKSKSFMKKHAAKEGIWNSNSEMIVLLMDYKLSLMRVVVNAETKGKFTCLNNEVEISQVYNSEGLFLCILKDTLRLAVWNPYLGLTRWIETRYVYREPETNGLDVDVYRYALGYSNKSHKILRFIDDFFSNEKNSEWFFWYEIYDFDTGLWKTLDFASRHWYISSYRRGVSLKGSTYWIATERGSRKDVVVCMICFDFTRERFGQLLPLPCGVWDCGLTNLSCVREEKLAVLFQYEVESTVEIWITTKIEEEEVLWSKFLTVDNMATIADISIEFSDGRFLIDEEKKLAMVFDKSNEENLRHTINMIGEDGYFREVDLGEDGYSKLDVRVCRWYYCWTHACPFVPSLVQIKQGRCEQSSLERHRCDENTSRLAAIQKRMEEERDQWILSQIS